MKALCTHNTILREIFKMRYRVKCNKLITTIHSTKALICFMTSDRRHIFVKKKKKKKKERKRKKLKAHTRAVVGSPTPLSKHDQLENVPVFMSLQKNVRHSAPSKRSYCFDINAKSQHKGTSSVSQCCCHRKMTSAWRRMYSTPQVLFLGL